MKAVKRKHKRPERTSINKESRFNNRSYRKVPTIQK